jgi:hypothetical protein
VTTTNNNKDFKVFPLKNGKEYRVNKWITRTYLVIICFIVLITYIKFGFDTDYHYYIECHAYMSNVCDNPFYMNSPDCSKMWTGACLQQTIPDGFTYGEKPPRIINDFPYIAFALFLFAILINHLLYNRGVLEWSE